MSAATVALIVGGDVNAAGLAATNAVENNNFINIPIPIEAAQLLVDEAKQGANFAMEEVEGAAKVRQGYHNGVDAVFDFLQGQYAGIYGADIIAEIFLPVLVQGMNPAFLEQFPGLNGVVPTKGQLLDCVRGGAHIAGDIAIPQNRLDVALVGAGFLKFPAGIINAVKGGRYALQATPEAVNAARGLAALDVAVANRNDIRAIQELNISALTSLKNPQYWTQIKQFTFHGQTNKVFQRNDLIDLTLKDARGRTNLELMRSGKAPIGPDNKKINLHHMLQSQKGPIAEVTQTFHQNNKSVIHINPHNIPSGINRVEFDLWKSDYWKTRVKELIEIKK